MEQKTENKKHERKESEHVAEQEHKEGKHDHAAHDHKHEEKKETPKVVKPVVKKDVAMTRGLNLHMSKRHGMYICSFIKGKTIDSAIADLEQVRMFKRAVPFKGEIPHRKGKGMMSGRYPVTAAGLFIPLLKTLKGNAAVNGMDLSKTHISTASANWGSRPQRKGGERAKRAYIILEAREIKQ